MSYLPILLFAVAGLFLGGAVSLHRQGASRFSVVLVAALAVLATTAGVLWMMPEDAS